MNWTGGRLKRHAGTHVDADVRARRILFARASRHLLIDAPNLCDIPHETSLSSSHHNDYQIGHYQYEKNLTPEHPPRDTRPHDQKQRVLHSTGTSTQPLRTASTTPLNRNSAKDASQHNMIEPNIPKLGSQTQKPARNFEAIRKSLLEQPDWLGLSAHRPVYIDFPSQGLMANVGRHQKQSTSKQTLVNGRSQGRKPQPEPVKITGRKRKRSNEEIPSPKEDSPHHFLKYRSFCESSESQTHSVLDTLSDCPQTKQPVQQFSPDHRRSFPPLATFDHERGSYRLAPDEHQEKDMPEDLISLTDLRGLQSFDMVKKKYQTSRENNGIITPVSSSSAVRHTVDENLPVNLGRQKQSVYLSPDSTSEPGPTFETPDNLVSEHLPVVGTSSNEPSREYEDALRSGSRSSMNLRLRSIPPVSSMSSSDKPGIAIKDFALTSSAFKGKYELQAPDLQRMNSVPQRFFLMPSGEMQQETPLGHHCRRDVHAHESTTSIYFQSSSSSDQAISYPPPKQFKLDTCYDFSSKDLDIHDVGYLEGHAGDKRGRLSPYSGLLSSDPPHAAPRSSRGTYCTTQDSPTSRVAAFDQASAGKVDQTEDPEKFDLRHERLHKLGKLPLSVSAHMHQPPMSIQPPSKQSHLLCGNTLQHARSNNQEAVQSTTPCSVMQGSHVSSTIFSTPKNPNASKYTTRHVAPRLSSLNVHSMWIPKA